MKKIESCHRDGPYIVTKFEGEKKVFHLDRTVGGVSWPTADSPGYYCILGRDPGLHEKIKKRLILLSEDEAKLPNELYKKIAGAAQKLLCRQFYADLNEQSRDFYSAFSEYMVKGDLRQISIDKPILTNWNTSILTMQQWKKDDALEISESILRTQLGKMGPEDRKDARKPFLHAVDGLRCALGEFVQSNSFTVRVPTDIPPDPYYWG